MALHEDFNAEKLVLQLSPWLTPCSSSCGLRSASSTRPTDKNLCLQLASLYLAGVCYMDDKRYESL